MINHAITFRLLAFPIAWIGLVQLVFGTISLVLFRDGTAKAFFVPAVLSLIVGLAPLRNFSKRDLSKANFKDALVYATATWVVVGFIGALPIVTVTGVSFTDAVFESISALTTTGATILSGLDDMAPTFLMYRQFLQWMGGLGIVIFVVAVLPMLNVGGMKLLKAETPGPVKDDKLSPRVANTAHYLWGVYLTLTLLCVLAYYLSGMTLYDAIAHAFTTVSTGGFSTHDASMWHFKSHSILWICNLFMVAGAINFGLHFRVAYRKNLSGYYHDEETRVFIYLIVGLSVLLACYLLSQQVYDNTLESLSFSTFHIISFMTSTGFGAASFSEWPAVAAYLLILAGYLGGCAGSTAGGNKIIRSILAVKIINMNMKQLIHPNGVFTVRYQQQNVSMDIRNATMSFMFFVITSTMGLTIAEVACGLDFWSALTAVAACVNVLGPGFGKISSNFQPISDTGIWILSGAMILGRLEYFTVFALFTVAFWKR